MTANRQKWRMSRRGFLIGLGATAVTATATFTLGAKIGLTEYRQTLAQTANVDNETPQFGVVQGFWTDPDIWFEITAANKVLFYSPKVEMGQGILTALGQIAADELAVAWADLEIIQVDTSRGMNDWGGTAGSYSVAAMYPLIREAAATLREMLRQEAAIQLKVPIVELVAQDTAVSHTSNPATTIPYGDLIQFADGWEVPTQRPPLKTAVAQQLIGQSLPRTDLLDKILGHATYGYDAHLPNMLYGAIARPPTVQATLRRRDEGNVWAAAGVQAILLEDDLAGVVANTRQQAYAALQQLDLVWDEGKLWQQEEIDTLITVGNGLKIVIQEDGADVDSLLSGDDPDLVSMELRTPLAAHATLEPQAALADVQADKVEIWTSTQAAFRERGMVAQALNRDPGEIVLHPLLLGGGLGRKLHSGAAVEAARLSQAAGKPVYVGWNRTEELRHGFLRPPTHHLLRGKVAKNGRIQAITHDVASSEIILSLSAGLRTGVLGIDAGIYRGATIQYALPNRRVTVYKVKLPVATGPWRGLGLFANNFAVESFIDALAAKAQMDPVAFRLLNLPASELGLRLKKVLQAVADGADWGGALPDNHAHGVALLLDVHTVVAMVAEVSVEESRVRVHKMVAAIDPGKIINPAGVTAQVEGAIMLGLSSFLFEKITVQDGQIRAANFDRYPLLTMKEAPDVSVHLLESGETPYGIGEPPIGPVAAAVSNAIFALTGKRHTQLPLDG